MDSRQHGVPQGEEFGVDAGEHGLAAAVAVSQREAQQVQQALWEAGEGQRAKFYNTAGHRSQAVEESR